MNGQSKIGKDKGENEKIQTKKRVEPGDCE